MIYHLNKDSQQIHLLKWKPTVRFDCLLIRLQHLFLMHILQMTSLLLNKRKFFSNSWVAVGCLPKVKNKGDILVTEVAGRSILVVRGEEDKLWHFIMFCRHRGSKLLNESCNIKSIRCPYHAWVYGLDGNVLELQCLRMKNP